MLILRRREGSWIEVKHHSGDVIRIRVVNVNQRARQCELVLDDPAHNFLIERDERNLPHSERVALYQRKPPVTV